LRRILPLQLGAMLLGFLQLGLVIGPLGRSLSPSICRLGLLLGMGSLLVLELPLLLRLASGRLGAALRMFCGTLLASLLRLQRLLALRVRVLRLLSRLLLLELVELGGAAALALEV